MNGNLSMDAPLFADVDKSMLPNEEYDRYLDEVAADRIGVERAKEKASALADAGKKKALENSVFSDYRQKAEVTILFLSKGADLFSADDVVSRIGAPPNRHILGAIFSGMVTRGKIDFAGWITSQRKSNHGRMIQSYRGKK